MVDEERVTRLLARIHQDVEGLREWTAVPAMDITADDVVLSAIKYRFVTIIEGCARVAHHVTVSEGWDVPETNADAMRELARRGVITEALGDAMASAAGFRNVLVHQYVEVDDSKVINHLTRLDDIDEFVVSVAQWLDA